jgi:hypothetical protein
MNWWIQGPLIFKQTHIASYSQQYDQVLSQKRGRFPSIFYDMFDMMYIEWPHMLLGRKFVWAPDPTNGGIWVSLNHPIDPPFVAPAQWQSQLPCLAKSQTLGEWKSLSSTTFLSSAAPWRHGCACTQTSTRRSCTPSGRFLSASSHCRFAVRLSRLDWRTIQFVVL